MNRDFGEFLRDLGTEKFRAIIIYSDSSLSQIEFAKKAASKYQGQYVDFIDLFQCQPDLMTNIDTIDIESFKAIVIEQSSGSQLLLITRMDFLLDVWSSDTVKSFYRLIKNQWNSFQETMQATLVFFLQTNVNLLDQKITNPSGHSRVLSLSVFKDID